MDELIWVKVETTKANDDVWWYKGQILKGVFEGIVSNHLATGYFKLDKVYWISQKYDDYGKHKGETLFQYGKDTLKVYEGALYLKIEHLVSIAPIDGEMELGKFDKNKDKPLKLVTPIRS